VSEEITPISLGDIEPKMKLKGTVKQIQLAGAIIDVGLEECDAFLHISQIRRRRVKNVADYLEEGQKIAVWVLSVDKANSRLDVSMIQPPDVTWEEIKSGQVYTGRVVRIEKFGVFVDIGAERPGLVHISELATGYVNTPGEVVEKGQEVEVKVIGVDYDKSQIDLSMKALAKPVETQASDEPQEDLPTAMALALQRALAGAADNNEETEGKKKPSGGHKNSQQEDILRRTLERHQNE
jgi:small subunit ribosomal protein S1